MDRPATEALNRALDRSWDRPTARDWAGVLGRLPLFAHMRKRQLAKVAKLARVREFAHGDVVIKRGEPGDGFYLILAGRARVVGKRGARPLRVGDYFGEMALLDGGARSATIAADGELQTMELPRRPFLRLLEQEPGISIAMLTELAGRVRALEKSQSS